MESVYKVGEVVDVYITKKKSQVGKVFGFERFQQVMNPMELEEPLNQIWIGLYKMRVNLSRFHRKPDGFVSQEVKQGQSKVQELRGAKV